MKILMSRQDDAVREEMVKKSGQMGVPVVDIDGQIIVGFNKEKICKLLKLKRYKL